MQFVTMTSPFDTDGDSLACSLRLNWVLVLYGKVKPESFAENNVKSQKRKGEKGCICNIVFVYLSKEIMWKVKSQTTSMLIAF